MHTIKVYGFVISIIFIVLVESNLLVAQESNHVSWDDCFRQDDEWYGSTEAMRIADQLLLYQRDIGGWPKNTDFAKPLSDEEKQELSQQKEDRQSCTIDNGATYTPMRYLAKVYTATNQDPYKQAFLSGLDFLLDIQYDNGGWPQYPYRTDGYYSRITFNDNAMIGLMNLLQDIVNQKEDYTFVSTEYRTKVNNVIEKGIVCILNSQIEVNGLKTAWCAQHDEETLEPAPARTYEKISISGSESVGIVRFLMSIDDPDQQVIDAIQSAVRWFDDAKIEGIRVDRIPDETLPRGYDRVVVEDENAKPMWARFYDIKTNQPIFSGRDGIIKSRMADIEHERRVGYSWYTRSAESLLEKDYPEWQRKWAPDENVLQ